MIIYRLADGSAWRANTLRETLTSMHFEAAPAARKARTDTFQGSGEVTSNEEPSTAAGESPARSDLSLSEKNTKDLLESDMRRPESIVMAEHRADSPV